jgi:hypothetical protein
VASPKGWWKRNFVKYHHQRADGKEFVIVKGLTERNFTREWHHQRVDGKG